MSIERMLQQYTATALWSSFDDPEANRSEFLDESFNINDFAEVTRSQMLKDCEAFASKMKTDIEKWGGDGDAWEQAGHDLWLTRNGHGTGFQYRCIGEWPLDGEALAKEAERMGKSSLYVGDDDKIYLEGKV